MQAVTVILSKDNENEDVQTLEDLLGFILNELENVGIGATLKIQEVPNA